MEGCRCGVGGVGGGDARVCVVVQCVWGDGGRGCMCMCGCAVCVSGKKKRSGKNTSLNYSTK